MAKIKYLSPLTIALLYLAAGLLWITYSDQWAIGISRDVDQLAQLQFYKGYFYVLITSIALYALVVAHRNQSLEAASLLTTTERRYEALFLANPYPTAVCKPSDGSLHVCNKALMNVFRVESTPERQPHIFELFEESERADLRQLLRSAGSGARPIQLRGHRSGGTELHLEVTAHRITFNKRDAVLLQMRDVTAEHFNREQVRLLTEHLEIKVHERTKQLEMVNEELSAFTYSVSHDLKAPIRAIKGFSEAIEENKTNQLDEQSRDYLGRIRRAAQKSMQLIEDMIRLSRITQSTTTIRELDFSALTASVAETLKQNGYQNVKLHIQPEMKIYADEGLLRIAMENLLSNAFKYSSRETQPVIEVGVISEEQEDEPVYFVRDNGIGLNINEAEHIFKPFQRLHKSEGFEGFGVGLATVKRIISRHGGDIRVESVPENGATFYFTICDSKLKKMSDSADNQLNIPYSV